jgi:invasion protein IalB
MKHMGFERALGARFAIAVVAGAVLSAAAFVQAAAAANATPATQAAAPAPAAQGQPPAGANPLWTKTCETNPQTKQQLCNTSQEIWLNTDGSVRASFGIQLRPDKKYAVAGFVPLSFIIPAGVQVTVDGDKKSVLQFVQCNPPVQGAPPGCLVVGEGSDDLIAAMRKGTKMALVVTDRQNKQLPIEMSLAGFGTAFDGAGMDPQAAAKAAIQKSKEFQDAAKAAAQRMIDKQRQETGAPATQN